METLISFLMLIAGLLLRLAIPLALTAVLIFFLRRLDAHWQAEAELPQVRLEADECWKTQNNAVEKTQHTAAQESTLPCWQAKRLPNGYLREECLACEIFTEAPMPALKTEPRRI